MTNRTLNSIENKFINENKKYIFLLLPIGILSFLIKNYYFEPEVPLTFDSLSYFFYATDITVLGHLPENYSLANNIWSIFLSLFFQLFQFENTIQYMDLQKNLSMVLSTLIIIPVYFLSRKFFEPKYSIIASFIFAVEPRIIQNSLLGVIEPLYIILGTMTLLFFLSESKKLIYFSFLFAALTSMIRGEGQIFFVIISIMFFVRFRKEKLLIPKYLIGLSIFILIITPMVLYQMEIQEKDAIFGRAVDTISYHTQDSSKTGGGSGLPFFIRGVENFIKFFMWDLVPIFMFFVPVGIYYLFKKYDYRKLTLIISGFGISIPAFYAYSIPLPDTRYLFMLYPIFCIISIFAIKKYSNYFKIKNIIIVLIIIGILLSSLIFLELKTDDNFQRYEIYQITKEIVKEPKVINSFYPEDHYLEPAALPEKWNDFKTLFLMERTEGQSVRNSILNPIKTISTEGYVSIDEYIKQNKELTHIYVDQNENRPKFLKDIYQNEDQSKFLIKEFDSKDLGYNYHVKIFRIDR
ncbi:conserved membrane hypothetical protein [metagenome]